MLRWILCLLFIGNCVGLAQAPDTLWTRTYGGCLNDFCRDLLVLPGGEVYLTGESDGRGNGNIDNMVVAGNFQSVDAEIRWYGNQYNEYSRRILARNNQSLAIFGQTRRISGTHEKFGFLAVTEAGDSLFSRIYGGPEGAHEFFYDAIEYPLGYALVGSTGSFGSWGNENFFVIFISESGDSLGFGVYGDARHQRARAISVFPDSTFVIVGDVNGSESPYDPIWVRITSEGDSITGGLLQIGYPVEFVTDVVALDDGRFVVSMTAGGGASADDGIVVCVSATGMIEWQWVYGGIAYQECTSICLTSRNTIVAVGSTQVTGQARNGWAAEIDMSGDELWATQLGGTSDEVLESVVEQSSNVVLAAGHTTNGMCSSWDTWLVAISRPTGHIIRPNEYEFIQVLSSDSILWEMFTDTLNDFVSIELNRHYPNGAWETIADSTENDGVYEWFVTDPLSDSCRIRICALADTFCDVSDGNFSIVSSQGYLALVKSSQPNAPLTSWDFGDIECPQTGAQWFRLKNFGSESIVVFQPQEPVSSEFARTTTCGAFFALAPNQMSACSVRVSFDPPADGDYNDVLRVQTDAVNGVNGFVEFGLNGAQISTPAAPDIVVSTSGLDAHLTWSAVDSSIGGCAVSDVWYAVFYAPTSGGPYYYHGWTADTAYTHAGVVNFSATMFYEVIAVDAPVAVAAELERGVRREEAILRIRNDE